MKGVCVFLLLFVYACLGVDFGWTPHEVTYRGTVPQFPRNYFKKELVSYANGGVSSVHYNVTINSKVFSLDYAPSIERVECFDDRLLIYTKDSAITSLWSEDTILTGGVQWNCQNEDGQPEAFYRIVISKQWVSQSVLRVETEHANFFDCLEEGDIKIRMDPTADAVAEAKRWGFNFHKIFSVNYNQNTGTAQNPRLDIFRFGSSNQLGDYQFQMACIECFAKVEAGLEFEIKVKTRWGWPPVVLKYFKFRIFGGYEANAILRASSRVSASYELERQILGSPIFDTISGSIGPIGFSIIPYLALFARGYLNAQGNALAEFSINAKRWYEWGTEYRRDWGEFRKIVPSNVNERNFAVKTPFVQSTAHLDARGTVIPELGMKFLGLVPVAGRIETYLGVEYLSNFDSRCLPSYIPSFQIYFGVDWKFYVGEVKFRVFGFTINIGQRFGLPLLVGGAITTKRNLNCAFCQGCVNVPGLPAGTFNPSPSVSCPNDGRCYNATSDPSDPEKEVCNLVPCEILCPSLTTCDSCLEQAGCSWCPSSGSCLASILNSTFISGDEDNEQCSVELVVDQCFTEPEIVITEPTSSSTWVGDSTYSIQWNGGGSKVSLQYQLSNDAFVNIAQNIDNNNQYDWKVPEVLSGAFKIRVSSVDQPENFKDSEEFRINKKADCGSTVDCVAFVAGEWGDCDRDCGTGGTWNRTVVCMSSENGIVDDSECQDVKPATEGPCDLEECKDFDIVIRKPTAASQWRLEDMKNATTIEWTGGTQYSTVKIEFRQSASSRWVVLEDKYDNVLSYSWDLSKTFGSSFHTSTAQYQIRITSSDNSKNSVVSDKFAIIFDKEYTITFNLENSFSGNLEGELHGTFGSANFEFGSFSGNEKTFKKKFPNLGQIFQLDLKTSSSSTNLKHVKVSSSPNFDSKNEVYLFGSVEVNDNTVVELDNCLGYQSCYECALLNGCGWCEDIKGCESGSEGGASRGPCADWTYESNDNSTCTGQTFSRTGSIEETDDDTESEATLVKMSLFVILFVLFFFF